MRSFILSVSADRHLTAIRNTVLAHAGYAVIPATSAQMAMQMLEQRKVSAMVIGNSISSAERRRLCVEGKKRGIPAVVLDQYEIVVDSSLEVHVDPLDGPEIVLEAVAKVLGKSNGKADG